VNSFKIFLLFITSICGTLLSEDEREEKGRG
jgi:hypothetical protein